MLFIKRKTSTSKQLVGDGAEDAALAFLQRQGLSLHTRNYRALLSKQAGEIDLIMHDATCKPKALVFVEVRARNASGTAAGFGGAAASVTSAKQARIVKAAQHFLQGYASNQPMPACRFDVVTVENGQIDWLKAAFDAF
jgi:putative endonuclease